MKTESIRWGMVGCGEVTEVKSGPAFQKADGSQLTAVMRRDGRKAEDYARRHHVPFWTDDAEELIHREDVDIVYIATPPGAHLELALKVCAAGKPCYVEKPMARSAAESRVMLEAFQRAGVPLFVAFYRRAQERFRTIKGLVESGCLGRLAGVSYEFEKPLPVDFDPARIPWRLNAAEAGAGLFYDMGSHLLDILDFLMAPLEDVAGVAANRAGRHDVEDAVAMSFTVMGAPGVARWNFAALGERDKIELEGTEGRITFSCFGNEPAHLESGGGVVKELPFAPPAHVHQPLVQTIVDELRGSGRCPSTGETALRTMRVMDTVLEGYYGGREDEFWKHGGSWPGKLDKNAGSK